MTMVTEEETSTPTRDAFVALLERLSRQSVTAGKHFDAYLDIPWDDPAYAIDRHDPRFELTDVEPLGATEWYRSQPQALRAEIGLHMIADRTRTGLQFENVLKRGLLEFASTL